jgi:hypothetical protein
VDLSLAAVHDRSLHAAMGREMQIKTAFANVGLSGDLNDFLSFTVVANPADDGVEPRPYVPDPADRRPYFFPNRPEGRGAVSDPSGLYKVDDYKHVGLDPILQQGALRIATVDVHARSGRYGAVFGRQLVPQGFGLDAIPWLTAKDLAHIQRIDAQADNGVTGYVVWRSLRMESAIVSGNGSPYHDYGYFDFTDAAEDKNSLVGTVTRLTVTRDRLWVGGSIRRNALNSRIEDSTSLQLSKHNDDALAMFGAAELIRGVRVFGEYARYTWGLSRTSADLLPGPAVRTPVIRAGYFAGIEAKLPATRWGRWGGVYIREELGRDDSLVAWAAANGLFGVRLGARQRSHILKVHGEFGRHLSLLFFLNALSNPFPELSAIRPIAGWGSDGPVSHRKIGGGLRLKL